MGLYICSYHESKHSPADLKNFWIVNDSFFISSFVPILKDIRKFVLLSGETVVVDIGDFPIGAEYLTLRNVTNPGYFYRILQLSWTPFGSNQTVGSGTRRYCVHEELDRNTEFGWCNAGPHATEGKTYFDYLQWTKAHKRYRIHSAQLPEPLEIAQKATIQVFNLTHRWHLPHFSALLQKSLSNTFGFYSNSYLTVDNDLLWPSWRKFNTIHLKSSELKNYMRKIFTKKIENSPQNVSWVFFGIQGVDASYVSY